MITSFTIGVVISLCALLYTANGSFRQTLMAYFCSWGLAILAGFLLGKGNRQFMFSAFVGAVITLPFLVVFGHKFNLGDCCLQIFIE